MQLNGLHGTISSTVEKRVQNTWRLDGKVGTKMGYFYSTSIYLKHLFLGFLVELLLRLDQNFIGKITRMVKKEEKSSIWDEKIHYY